MNYANDWEGGSVPVSLARGVQTLPLLPTILVSVLVGILGAAMVLSAGYGLIAAMSCYVFLGASASFLLPIAFRKIEVLRRGSGLEEYRQKLSKEGAGVELEELDQHFLSELEWLDSNTVLELAAGSSIMFVTGETKEARDIRDLFREGLAHIVRETRSLQDATSIILDAPERWKLLCVDVDPFGGVVDLDTAVEQLLAFRDAVSSVPVMLMSRSFSLDPFHLPHRPSIADSNLRIPASDCRVRRALKDTYINNHIWRSCLEISPV
ncbi:hypothetical protein [Cognatiyoonia sp. IB215182]|uniref:hypothetical protein n=1 Tax=Cognatiyoonia sp. IB215182 TaxID=3097353 RepID=UPI002A12A5B8|nr:hypothetical protein [Cognatiyoonia sp. IB215182]MDX8355794.1 hypothetical protein [Cognatiyoonia sp. IB215182]